MTATEFPKDWDEARVRRVLEHYEIVGEEAVAEDDAAFEDQNQATFVVSQDLVPEIDELIARHARG